MNLQTVQQLRERLDKLEAAVAKLQEVAPTVPQANGQYASAEELKRAFSEIQGIKMRMGKRA